MIKKIVCLICFVTVFFACNNKSSESNVQVNKQEFIETKGKLVSKDSIIPPVSVLAGKPTLLQIDKSFSVPGPNTIHNAGIPKVFPVGKPFIAIPGNGVFSLPIICPIKDTVVPYVQSEPVPSERPRYRDDASCNIQYFDVDQGMPSSYVSKIYEDKFGNIWFGSSEGLTKFDGKSYSNFTEKEGFLGQARVRAILEDKNGNLWIGSGKGACKYDGETFTYYDLEKEGMSKFIRSIIEDKQGNLWFASSKGVSCFDGKKFTYYSEKQGLVNNEILCMLCDKSGNVWIGTESGLSKFDGKQFYSYTKEEGLISSRIAAMAEDKDGNIWISSLEGICKYTGNTFVHYTESEGLLNNNNRSIIVDKENNVWIACYGAGLCKFDGKQFTYFTDKEGLSINIILNVMEDKSGNIWVGTDGAGVCKYFSKSFSHFTEKQGMGKTIMSVFEDKQENIWLGAYASGLWKYDGNTFTLFKSNSKENVIHTVRSMVADSLGNIWFGSESSGLIKYNNFGATAELYTTEQGLSSNVISCMFLDKKGNLLVGTNGGGLNKFDGKNFTSFKKEQGLLSNVIKGIVQDRNGNYWIATDRGLNKFSVDSVICFTEKDGLISNDIKNIIEDSNGDIWVGTAGGLSKYNGKVFANYSEKNGLSNNIIRSLVADKPKNLPKGMIGIWVSTDNGINHLLIGNKYFSDSDSTFQEVKINVYKRADGLKGEDFTTNSGYQDSKSRIWWGSVKSLTMVDATRIISENEIPQIKLDYIKLEQKFIDFRSLQDSIKNKKDWYVDEKKNVNLSNINFTDVPAFYNYPLNLELPYNLNNIEFYFSSIDWNSPHKLRYQYTLEGFDKEWHPITSETKAIYTSLGSGEYTFKVKAKGFSDIWSEPFEYHFMIHPPWWQTVWAYAIYFLVFVIGIFMVFKWRTKALVARQKELEITIDERTADVVEEKNRVIEKNQIIENKQKEIIDSIMYARRIQNSLLPTEKYIEVVLKRLTKKNKKE